MACKSTDCLKAYKKWLYEDRYEDAKKKKTMKEITQNVWKSGTTNKAAKENT